MIAYLRFVRSGMAVEEEKLKEGNPVVLAATRFTVGAALFRW